MPDTHMITTAPVVAMISCVGVQLVPRWRLQRTFAKCCHVAFDDPNQTAYVSYVCSQ